MARIVVLYESKNGFTRACVERLQKEMNFTECKIVDLNGETPELCPGDILVVGTPVRCGKLMKKAAAFLKEIESKPAYPVGVFLCCGFADRFSEYCDRLIPKAIRSRAFCIINFGGTLNPAGKPFWDKLWLWNARSQVMESEIEDGEFTPVLPGMIPENIGQMATFAKKELLAAVQAQKGKGG